MGGVICEGNRIILALTLRIEGLGFGVGNGTSNEMRHGRPGVERDLGSRVPLPYRP